MQNNSNLEQKDVTTPEIYEYNNGALFEYMFLTKRNKVFIRCCEKKSIHEIEAPEFIEDFKIVEKKDD